MIHIRSTGEVQKISRACQIVKETLEIIQEMIVPGISTLELDIEAEKFIRSKGAQPGFKGLYGYPATLCVSVEDEVVHGIPNNRKLQDGEIVSVDVGSLIEGYYGDHAKSFAVGKVDPEKEKLMSVTRECLLDGIDQATPGNRISDIGHAVQKRAESNGYGVVTELEMPYKRLIPNDDEPSSYINFYIANKGIVMPSFDDEKADNNAQKIIEEIFPNRKVIAINGIDISMGGGNVHCITQQQPLGV